MNVIGKKQHTIPQLANTAKPPVWRGREPVQLSPGQQASLDVAQATLARLTNCLLKVASSGASGRFKKNVVPLPTISLKSESPFPSLPHSSPKPIVEPVVIHTPLPQTEKQRYQATWTLAAHTVQSLRERLQLTHADWLEEIVNNQKDFVATTDTEYKKTREQLEDAIDSLDDVPFLDQLLLIPEDYTDITALKAAFVDELHNRLNVFLNDIAKQKTKLLELVKYTPENEFKQALFHFIDDREAKSLFLQSEIANDNLDCRQLTTYKKKIDDLIASTHQRIEKETRLENIILLKQSYNFLDNNSHAAIVTLITNGNFFSANVLDKTQKKHSQLLEAAAKDLTSTAKIKAYAKTLENAIKDLTQKALVSQAPPQGLIAQFQHLDESDFPYYDLTRDRLVEGAKAKIDACISQLERYTSLLSAALPVFEQQASKEYPTMLAIRNTLEAKSIEIAALRTSFVTRAFFWHVFPVETPVEELPSDKFVEYIKFVDHLIQKTLADLTEDAAQAGFTWN